MKIGVLGGTFDPIHNGHLAAARAAMDCARLDRVLFIPSAQPPHRAAAVAPAEARLEMSRLAIEGEAAFEVSDIEVRRGGRSYTADTLAALRLAYPSEELFLILGWDAAKLFSSWHEPDTVKRLATVVIVSRPGTSSPDTEQLAAAGLDPEDVVLCLRPTPDVSGSALRRAIRAGRPITNDVPAAVERFITTHGLYMDNQ
jgi:nicotinate-nucleotide adenylyltransferase